MTDTIILCMPNGASPFSDNVTGPCSDCGIEIMWRPHVPEPSLKLCLNCGAVRIKASEEVPEYVITKETGEDLRQLGYVVPSHGRLN